MKKSVIEKIEIDLFLEAVERRYGYDFKNYARASFSRRVRHVLVKTGCSCITEMTQRILHEESFFEEIIPEFSIPVTEMFRDPEFYIAVRETIIPFLSTYPFVKIWHAGCATGEEVYSLAIVLKEEGLYDRATIFATDFNDYALGKAKEGVYPVNHMKQYTSNYQKAGGTASFSEYYNAQYESAIMNQSLKKNITFAKHNLVTDSVFGEMNIILCRNVLIYFNKTLQERVFRLFSDSLIYRGFLCLGTKESLRFSSVFEEFKELNKKQKIYQRTIRN